MFDTIRHKSKIANIDDLNEIVSLLKARTKPQGMDNFPAYRYTVGKSGFADRIFTQSDLAKNLAPERILAIEKALAGRNNEHISIEEIIPWQKGSFPHLNNSLDFIFSHSVMEHVDDIYDAYNRMYAYLKPGGGISHSVDLKSHGYGLKGKFNGQLTVEPEEWKNLTQSQPYSINRHTMSEHIQAIRASGFDVVMQLVKTNLGGITRQQLASPFAHISDADLMCGNLFIQAFKPVH